MFSLSRGLFEIQNWSLGSGIFERVIGMITMEIAVIYMNIFRFGLKIIAVTFFIVAINDIKGLSDGSVEMFPCVDEDNRCYPPHVVPENHGPPGKCN